MEREQQNLSRKQLQFTAQSKCNDTQSYFSYLNVHYMKIKTIFLRVFNEENIKKEFNKHYKAIKSLNSTTRSDCEEDIIVSCSGI